jgi:type VI secretion system protein VasD
MRNKLFMKLMPAFRIAAQCWWTVLPRFRSGTDKRSKTDGVFATVLIGCLMLGGCSTAAITTGKVAELALSAIGLKMPGNGDAAPSKTVELHIAGTRDLNAGEDGQGLSTVVRLYRLRDQTGFLSMPYSEFGAADKEKASLGADLVDVKELVLAPGQILDLQEKMPGDIRYLGVVALLRAPDPQRWRFAFSLAEADSQPIAVAVNACAMTAATTLPYETTPNGTPPKLSTSCQ